VGWLTSQSLWFLVPVCLAIALLVAIGGRMALLALVPPAARENAHSVAAPLMPALGAAFAILAALTLSNEVGRLSSSEMIVSSEAADGARLAWAATMPGVRPAPIHGALRRYLQATRRHEWHGANAAQGNDPATVAAIGTLERRVRSAAVRAANRTSTSTELLASVDAITSDRRARLAADSKQLPAFYVITVAISGIALITNASALTLRFRPRVAVLVGGLAVVVGLSMALILGLGTISRGPIVVSGGPIDALIRDLGSGYFRSR